MNNGYIYVATVKKCFYESACYSALTLRDYYPDANITLFTHEKWVDKNSDVFDNVVTKDVPEDIRAKMWAMARTPYNKTFYLDADTEIRSSEISKVFDQLDENYDLVMGQVREYAHAIVKFPGGRFKWHCGVCVYNNKSVTLELMQDWYDFWVLQQEHYKNNTWDLDDTLYPRTKLWHWDTWTFWRLLNLEGYKEKIKIKSFDNFAKWNWHNYVPEELKGEDVVVYHHTIYKT